MVDSVKKIEGVDMELLHKLTRDKVRLERQQAEVVKETRSWLTAKGGDDNPDEDGAIENSRKKVKNLEAAIATARQPGYFEYHRRSKKVRFMEKKKELQRLHARVMSIQRELDNKNAQIDQFHADRKAAIENARAPNVTGLKDWFARYGELSKQIDPTRQGYTEVKGMKSEFVPNTKVYGGTKHMKAFKSVAVTLKKGRVTR